MIDRRTYFKQMALISGGFIMAPQLLFSCKGKPEINLAGKYKMEPFASMEEMLNAAQLSKGHLTHEMKRLIESKDAKTIFEFVQSRFSIIPPSKKGITNSVYNTRWGMRGVLRCGKGTMREISDLLMFMYKKSGIDTEYFRAAFPMSNMSVNHAFCSTKEDNDQIIIPTNYKEKWAKSLAQNNVETINIDIKDVEVKSMALVEKLKTKLPINYLDQLEDNNWLNYYNKELKETEHLDVPIIRIKQNEEVKDLNLFENKPFDDFSKTISKTYKLKQSKSNKKIKKVRLILRVQYSDQLGYPIELVRGEWDFESLVGRQIVLQFTPPVPIWDLLNSSYEQINTFVPLLTLRDPGMSIEKRRKNSFPGMGFDMHGNTFENTNKGVIVNGVTLNGITEKDTEKAVKIKATISNYAYPKIKLHLAPLDVNGEIVYGLSTAAFSIKDNDDIISPLMTSNFKNPKLLIIMDQSASMPCFYSDLSYEYIIVW